MRPAAARRAPTPAFLAPEFYVTTLLPQRNPAQLEGQGRCTEHRCVWGRRPVPQTSPVARQVLRCSPQGRRNRSASLSHRRGHARPRRDPDPGPGPGLLSAGRHLGAAFARPPPRSAWPPTPARAQHPAPSLTAPREARAYLSPACRQYATMMSREGARRAESRGRVNVGSARGPVAGRSGQRSGRGGAPALPIPPPSAPPALTSSPCCPVAESPRRRQPMGERGRGRGCQSPGRPGSRACLLAPRAPGACAPRASVVAGGVAGVRGGWTGTAWFLACEPRSRGGGRSRGALSPPGYEETAASWGWHCKHLSISTSQISEQSGPRPRSTTPRHFLGFWDNPWCGTRRGKRVGGEEVGIKIGGQRGRRRGDPTAAKSPSLPGSAGLAYSWWPTKCTLRRRKATFALHN